MNPRGGPRAATPSPQAAKLAELRATLPHGAFQREQRHFP
jgi:hypothetical protein